MRTLLITLSYRKGLLMSLNGIEKKAREKTIKYLLY